MKWPPYLMKLIFHGTNHGFSIWLPLFIIGPIALLFLLALCLIALPFFFLSLLFTWRWYWLEYAVIGAVAFFGIVWSLPGFKVDIEDRGQHIAITIY